MVDSYNNNLPEKPDRLSEFLLYQTEDGQTRIRVRLLDGTVWLPQRLIAELYQKDVRTVTEHIQNGYIERELTPEATIRKFRKVQYSRARRNQRLEVSR